MEWLERGTGNSLIALLSQFTNIPKWQLAKSCSNNRAIDSSLSVVAPSLQESCPQSYFRIGYPTCPTGLWATSFRGRCPGPWQQGWNWLKFKVPSNRNCSVILLNWTPKKRSPHRRLISNRSSQVYHSECNTGSEVLLSMQPVHCY